MTLDDKPGPLESFKISKRVATEQCKNLELQLSELDGRIQSLVDRVIVNKMPILNPILLMTHDKDELELLGRALPRVAELVTERDKIAKRLEFCELVIREPETIALLAGDFLDDFDTTVLLREE